MNDTNYTNSRESDGGTLVSTPIQPPRQNPPAFSEDRSRPPIAEANVPCQQSPKLPATARMASPGPIGRPRLVAGKGRRPAVVPPSLLQALRRIPTGPSTIVLALRSLPREALAAEARRISLRQRQRDAAIHGGESNPESLLQGAGVDPTKLDPCPTSSIQDAVRLAMPVIPDLLSRLGFSKSEASPQSETEEATA